jgi:ubiquinone/menaquinone biosynthesis C-methylase UbiE
MDDARAIDSDGLDFRTLDFGALERAGWEDKARAYYQACRPITYRLIDPLLDAARVASGTRVLDVGSGPGDVAARAAERGARAVGLDLAQAMVSLAAEVHPGLDFIVGDAQSPPFEECSFDAIVGNFSFHHLRDQARALAAWRRLLRPGGCLALTAWDEPQANRLLGLFADALAEVDPSLSAGLAAGSSQPAMFVPDDRYHEVLRAAGFHPTRVESVSFILRLGSAEALWAGVLAATVRTAASIESLAPDTRARVREAFERLVAGHRTPGGLAVPAAVKLISGAVSRRGGTNRRR